MLDGNGEIQPHNFSIHFRNLQVSFRGLARLTTEGHDLCRNHAWKILNRSLVVHEPTAMGYVGSNCCGLDSRSTKIFLRERHVFQEFCHRRYSPKWRSSGPFDLSRAWRQPGAQHTASRCRAYQRGRERGDEASHRLNNQPDAVTIRLHGSFTGRVREVRTCQYLGRPNIRDCVLSDHWGPQRTATGADLPDQQCIHGGNVETSVPKLRGLDSAVDSGASDVCIGGCGMGTTMTLTIPIRLRLAFCRYWLWRSFGCWGSLTVSIQMHKIHCWIVERNARQSGFAAECWAKTIWKVQQMWGCEAHRRICIRKSFGVFSIFKNIWKAWRCKKLRNALIFVLQPQ